jgi:hypothetical protein
VFYREFTELCTTSTKELCDNTLEFCHCLLACSVNNLDTSLATGLPDDRLSWTHSKNHYPEKIRHCEPSECLLPATPPDEAHPCCSHIYYRRAGGRHLYALPTFSGPSLWHRFEPFAREEKCLVEIRSTLGRPRQIEISFPVEPIC